MTKDLAIKNLIIKPTTKDRTCHVDVSISAFITSFLNLNILVF